jgi:hypothetical protein
VLFRSSVEGLANENRKLEEFRMSTLIFVERTRINADLLVNILNLPLKNHDVTM